MVLAKRLGRIAFYLALYGLFWGGLLGAVYGLIFFIVGAIFGLMYGGIAGGILGIISGIVAAAVTGLFYADIKVWQYEQYRRTIRTICACIGFFGQVIYMGRYIFHITTLRDITQSPGGAVLFVLVPGLLAGFAAARSANRIARWYIDQPHENANQSDSPVSGWQPEKEDSYATR